MPRVPDFIFDLWQCYKKENNAVIDFMINKAGNYVTSRDVPLSQLVPVARHLVMGRKQPVVVPARIVRSLKRTIELRKRCGYWYQTQYAMAPSPALLLANQQHQYPIEILEEVLSVLEPHIASAKTTKEGKQAEAAVEQEDMSTITQLEVFSSPELRHPEPTAEHDSPGIIEGSASTTSGPSSLPPLSKTLKKSLGKATARGENMFLTIYLLLQSLEPIRQSVRRNWESFQRDPSRLIFASLAMDSAIGFAGRLETEFRAVYPEHRDWETVMAKLFSPAAELQQDPTTKAKKTRRVDASSDNDQTLLNQYCIETCVLGAHNENLPAADEVTLGLREVLTYDQKISLKVVFGLVLLFDKWHILSEDRARGFDRLVAVADAFEVTKGSQTECENIIQGQKLSNDARKAIFSNVNLINEWIKTDRFKQLREEAGLESEVKIRDSFAFYKRNTQAMAHLYNALRCEELISVPWRDMEEFITLHGDEYHVKNDISEELTSNLSRLCLSEGLPIKALAKHPRKTSKLSTKSREPSHIKPSKIIGTLDDMLCPPKNASTEITVDQVEATLVAMAKRETIKNVKGDPLYAQWNKHHRLSPSQLLMVLEECLIEETPKLSFNYYALHRICFKLLHVIENPIHDQFMGWIPDPPGPKANRFLNLPMLTHYLFEHDKQFGSGEKPMLKMAARVIEGFLSKAENDGQTKIII